MKSRILSALIASFGLAMPAAATDDTPIIDAIGAKATDGDVARLGTLDPAFSAATPAQASARILASDPARLRIVTPDGQTLMLERVAAHWSNTGEHVWRGATTVKSKTVVEATLVAVGEDLAASTRTATHEYRLIPQGQGGHVMLALDLARARPIEDRVMFDVAASDPSRDAKQDDWLDPTPPTGGKAVALPATSTWIDVMVAVDKRISSTTSAANALARLRIEGANRALLESRIPVVVELAGVYLAPDFVGYQPPPPAPPGVCPENVLSQDPACRNYNRAPYQLDALVKTNDGLLDRVHSERNAFGADAVMLVSFTDPPGGVCGIARSLRPTQDEAFAVASEVSGCDYLFEHEFAHLLSADHDVPAQTPGNAKPYAHGFGRTRPSVHSDPGYITVMTYRTSSNCPAQTCVRIGQFSNPRVTDDFGLPMGTEGTHDNARAMSEEAPRVSAFRTPPAVSGVVPFNVGLNGTWYEATTSGQGLAIEVVPAARLVSAGWYTYSETGFGGGGAGDQRWYTLTGSYAVGARNVAMTIHRNAGGRFNAPPSTSSVPVGNATLSFQSCTSATLDYSLHGRNNRIRLQRLTPDVFCQQMAGGAQVAPISFGDNGIHFGMGGNWYNPATGGQGLAIEIVPSSNDFTAGWFTYVDSASPPTGAEGQRWFTVVGRFSPGARGVTGAVIYQNLGGRFDAPPATRPQRVGTMSFQFFGCTQAGLTYRFDDGRTGTIMLQRLTPAPLCRT